MDNKEKAPTSDRMNFLQGDACESFSVGSTISGGRGQRCAHVILYLLQAEGGEQECLRVFSLPPPLHLTSDSQVAAFFTHKKRICIFSLGSGKWPCGILLFSSSLKSSLVVDECRNFVIN